MELTGLCILPIGSGRQQTAEGENIDSRKRRKITNWKGLAERFQLQIRLTQSKRR